ncbi:hypothetical protein PanWU01x14_063240 [Parasponia andersonii]|uniref:Uncharacterized protein n=1 Tax=Parasponia andersonii TaxID=3476 RepID=A0A2P5DHZ2_PARAD|nr:hypothetical protein PanWU01x14_063240 [Parasponia andersonii]
MDATTELIEALQKFCLVPEKVIVVLSRLSLGSVTGLCSLISEITRLRVWNQVSISSKVAKWLLPWFTPGK